MHLKLLEFDHCVAHDLELAFSDTLKSSDILALLPIVCIPYVNHDVSKGQVIRFSSFARFYTFCFSYGFVVFKQLANQFEYIVLHTHPGSTRFLLLFILVEFL